MVCSRFRNIRTLNIFLIIFLEEVYMYQQISSERSNLYFLSSRKMPVSTIIQMNYTVVNVNSQSTCVVNCAARKNCGHAVFCGNSESCYLDDKGVNYCGSKFTECTCFAKWRNVAVNARCDASSEYSENLRCTKALDGSMNRSWSSRREGVGAWIKVYLDKPRILEAVRLVQRPELEDRNKDIRFEFSDGTVQELPYHDLEGNFWDDLELQQVTTSWVNITVLSVYNERNSGWKEIELYSSA